MPNAQSKAMHTIGADPEFFIVDEMNYDPMVAVGLVDGSKENPLPLHADLHPQFNYHRDNVMLEVGVPPTQDPYVFVENINTAIMYANDKLSRLSQDGQHLAIYRNMSVLQFPDFQLDSPEAREFGCEPDQDAYEGGAQRHAPDDVMGNFRTAGGHVHIGIEGGSWNCPNFIVALLCDAYLGVFDTNLANVGAPQQPHTHYRKPGLYRDKPYGIEYRTPSNEWTFNNNKSYAVGRRALAVSQFCERATANKIRKKVETIDWIWVRSVIETGVRDATLFEAHKKTIKAITKFGGE